MGTSPSNRMPTGFRGRVEHKKCWLPFGYNLQWEADLLVLRRSDGSFVAAFNAGNVDPFEVEWAVWEDAD